MQELRCAEIWGGTESRQAAVSSAGVVASLFSSAVDGGRGGDIYFLSKCNHDLLTRVVVADVCGHGQVVSAMSRYLYDAMIAHIDDDNEAVLLEDLNSVALAQGIRGLTTAAVASYYKADGSFCFAYAGHPPPLLKRVTDSVWMEIQSAEDTNGPPLAVTNQPNYRQNSIQLSRGDRIAFYTDGLLDAADRQHRRYGVERFKAQLMATGAASLEVLCDTVIADARTYAGGEFRHDDVTLLLMEVV